MLWKRTLFLNYNIIQLELLDQLFNIEVLAQFHNFILNMLKYLKKYVVMQLFLILFEKNDYVYNIQYSEWGDYRIIL